MLRGIGYVVAGRGDKKAGSKTATCLVLAGWTGRMPGVKQPLRED